MRWILGLVIVLGVAFAAIAAIEDERRAALVIGNGDYQYAAFLPNPVNDAEAIAEKLRSLDFDVTTAVDLGRDEMEAAVLRFGQESEGSDVVLIFYAGHGIQMDGENYLLSVDAQLEGREDLRDGAIEEARLHSVFAFVEPELSLLIMDACRTNPFQGLLGVEAGLASGGAAKHELGSSRSTEDMMIVFSAAPGQVALDGESGNSPFTTALLQWIDYPGLEVDRIFRHVRRTVIDLTGGQIPWVESSLTREAWLRPPGPDEQIDSFESLLAQVVASFENPLEREAAEAHFRRLIPDSRLLEETRVASSGQIANDAQSDLEALRWLSIRRSEDPAVFENFLDAFPEGKFAGLAREHIAELDDILTNAGGSTDEEMAFAPASGEGPLDTDVAAEPAVQEASLDIEALSAMETELGLDRDGRIAVQQLLAVMGNYTGALDGAIGPMSRAAIAAFQVDAGLAGTGYLDIDSLARLVEAAAKPALAEEADPNRRGAIHGLAAVARFGPGAAPTTIRVASIARHPEVEAVWRAVADRFEADNPGYPVVFDSRPGAEYKAQLLGMLGSETPPDILFTWGGGHLRAIAHAGFATDLTEAMAAGWAFDYKPGALNNLIIDERIYAAPSNMSLVNLWANRTLLDKAGIEPESLKTWEGLLDAVTRLKAAGVMPIGVGGADRWPLAGYWAGLALAIAGPDGLDAALQGDAEGFEAPAFVEAGVRLKDLADMEPFQANYRDLSNIDAVRAFIGGWTAMNLTGDWAYVEMSRNWPGGPDAAAENLVRIPFPPTDLGAGGQGSTIGGSDGWVLRAGAPEPALELLEHLANLEIQTELARLGHLVPSIAGADDAIGSPTLSAVATELTLSRHHQLFLDQVLGPQAGEKLNDVAVAIVDGDLTPEDAAAEIERAWEDARPTLAIDAAEGAATSETVE